MENFRFVDSNEEIEGYEGCLNSEDCKFLFDTQNKKIVKRINKKPMMTIGEVMQKLMKTKQESLIKKKALIAQLLKEEPGNRIPLIETLLESNLSLNDFKVKVQDNKTEPKKQEEPEHLEEPKLQDELQVPLKSQGLNQFGDDDSMFKGTENTSMLGGVKEPEPEPVVIEPEPVEIEPDRTQTTDQTQLADLVANKTLERIKDEPIKVNLEELKSLIQDCNQPLEGQNLGDKLVQLEVMLKGGFDGIFEKFSEEKPKVTPNFLEVEKPISDKERELINQYEKSEGLIGFTKTKAFEEKQETTVIKNGVNLIEGADEVIEGASLGLFEFISIHFPFVLLEYQQQIKERL